jgi:hypothetical protein
MSITLYLFLHTKHLEISDFMSLRFYVADAEILRVASIDLLNHQQYHLA